MDDEEAKRIQEERDNQLTEEYKELQNPKTPEEKQNWNPVNVIQEAFGDIKESGEVWDESRQQFLTQKVAPLAQKVDDSLTDITGQNWIGDRSRNVINFGADLLTPTSGDLAVGAAVLPLTAVDGPLPFGDAAAGTIAGLKYGSGVTGRLYKKTSQMLDDVFDKRVQKLPAVHAMSEQTERMATGFKENIDKIPKKNRATDFELIGSEKDIFARVTKPKIKKLVDQFGGSDEVVDSIFQEQVVRFQNYMSQRSARSYLNEYFKKLTAGLGPDGLKNARIQNINGKPRLVDGRTKNTIDHAFEVDHHKAKEMMKELGLEGADMHENLEIVYSVFNRRKNDIGNPAIPDEILEAVGQSTTLENFVRRRVDESFMLAGERVPQRFKETAKVQMMDDAINLKPGETLESVIEKRLKLYDKASIELVKADDYLPPKIQLQISAQDNLNPIEYFSELSKRSDVPKRIRNKYKRLAEDFKAISQPSSVTLERGYGANEASKTKYYRDDGHEI